jgi:hypothetical protein
MRISAASAASVGKDMIGNSMLGRVIAVALAVGAVTPAAVAQDWQGRGFQQQDDEVRRVGRRGRDDGDEESASDEAHERNAEREARREAERQQREQERSNEQQARQAEQQQREEARMYEQQQREAQQQQRQAEQQQREAMRGMEQQQRQAEEQQREMQRAAEQQQRQAEMEQRAYQREQRQAEQLRQPPIEAEQAREQQRRGRDARGGREEGWAEQERAREQAAGEQYRAEQQRQAGSRQATEELRRVEQERTQVQRGGDRERYQDYREGREGRGERERVVSGEPQPQWRDRDQRRDAQQWDDPRRRWSADPRQVAIPRDGARLSDRERRTFYDQQRQSADRYGRDWSRRIDTQQRRIESLQHDRRGQQYRYQQRYWQRHRDYRSRWTSFRWNYDRDPFFWTAPSHRYYRGGRWYSVNRYAIDVLQQAIRIGYEEGYYAGEADRYDGWRGGWRDNYAYEDATLGFQGWYVGENEYRYYFREGFRRGYEDAFNRRWRYGRRYESGYSILPNELDLILRFELRR